MQILLKLIFQCFHGGASSAVRPQPDGHPHHWYLCTCQELHPGQGLERPTGGLTHLHWTRAELHQGLRPYLCYVFCGQLLCQSKAASTYACCPVLMVQRHIGTQSVHFNASLHFLRQMLHIGKQQRPTGTPGAQTHVL